MACDCCDPPQAESVAIPCRIGNWHYLSFSPIIFYMKREDLEKLALLSRMELRPEEGEKLLHDLGKVLDYFKELQELSTDDISPMTGGTSAYNVVREDDAELCMPGDAARGMFPEKEDGYLKVPPVFGGADLR